MPNEWTTRIWREFRAGTLTRGMRDVLLTLKTFRGVGGNIWPSHDTLAERVEGSVSSVQRALKQGRRLGLLDWIERRVRRGWRWLRTSNAYTLMVPDTDVEPTMKPVWPRRRTTGQNDRGGDQPVKKVASESKKSILATMLREAAALPDLLLQRRRAMEARLMGNRS